MSPALEIALSTATLAASTGLYRYMRHVEPNRIEVTYHEVRYEDLPAELDGLTLCQVSDVHITPLPRNAEAISRAIRSVNADLYLLTGDMIFLQPGIDAFFRWLDDLGEAIRPAIAILGNAEHKPFVRREEVERGLAERGVPLLKNETMAYPIRDTGLQIVGVDDPHTGHSDFKRAYARACPATWTLLLCHSPDGATERAGCRADLMLCGHTHGGQFRLPLVGALRNNTRRARSLTMGWYEGDRLTRGAHCPAEGTRLYVSRGLGTSRYPMRLLCRPELPVFTLRRAAL